MWCRRDPFSHRHVSPVATVSLTGHRLCVETLLEQWTGGPTSPSVPDTPRYVGCPFLWLRPSRRGFGCRPHVLVLFSFSLLYLGPDEPPRLPEPFSLEWGFIPTTKHTLPRQIGPGLSPGQALSSRLTPPRHLRRQLLYHYVFIR